MRKLSLSPAFLRKAARRTASTIAVIAVTGFLLLPAILRPVLEGKASEALHRAVAIRSVYINPFTLAFALRGVTVSQRGSADVMLSFDEFSVNLQARSVVSRGLILSSVRLIRPYIRVTRNGDLTYNFGDLIPPPAGPAKEEQQPRPFRFSINNIELKDGSIDFIDEPNSTTHTVRDLNIAVPFVSDLPYDLSDYVEPSFRATVNGTAFELKGKTLPFKESLETALDINWKGVDLPHYLAYSPVPLTIRLLSGTLDVKATISFRQFEDRPPKISVAGIIGLNNVRLAATGTKRFLEFPLLSVSFLPSDLMEKEVHLADVSLRAPKLYVERDRGGELIILKAILAQLGVVQGRPEPAPAKAGPLPVIDVDAFSIRDGTLQFLDWQPVPVAEEEDGAQGPAAVLIDNIALTGGSLSTRPDSKGRLELSMRINRNGMVRTAGTFELKPFDLDTAVNVSGIELAPFQPYVAQRADILVDDGRFAADGTARVRAGEDGALSVTYRGSASVSRLALSDSRDSEDLLAWKLLQASGIEAGSGPPFLRIQTIALSDFTADIVIEEDGNLNLQTITRKGAAPEQSPAGAKEAPPSSAAAEDAPAERGRGPDITIGQVLLANGTISFTDRHVKPMYVANLVGINGKVTGLSSEEDMMADVLLSASLEQYAPLAITGKIHPLGKDLSADIRADFKDMDLSELTPYSGTYIGSAIEKGKLSFGLEYHIANRKLEAKNSIFIDQLTLGEKVDSQKATSLPVGLAIALLKDRNGEIRLDIPVAGEIDNPEFRVGKVILQVLVNLLVKAATSPFALLGSLIGAGEDLGYVEFDFGASALSDANAKKLDALAKALYDRPNLKLEIAA
jgi:hypothetical protein